jgi:hypothetical protein
LARSGTITGVALIVIGLIILGFGAYMYYANTNQSQVSLLRTNNYTIGAGDNQNAGIVANAGQVVSGTFNQVNGSSVNFYFMSAAQQDAWGNCAPCASPAIVNASNPGTYSYRWTVNNTGTYYLVMDNSNGANKVAVTLTAMTPSSSTPNSQYEIAMIVGIAVVVIGLIVLASGRKKTVAKEPVQTTPAVSPTAKPAGT